MHTISIRSMHLSTACGKSSHRNAHSRPLLHHLLWSSFLFLLLGMQWGCQNRVWSPSRAHYLHALQTAPGETISAMDINRAESVRLAEMLQTRPDGEIHSLIAVSFVSLDDLDSTSAFGRISAEQYVASLVRAGYEVLELRLARSIVLDPAQGEFGLSRRVDEVSATRRADALLTGTYTTGRRHVHVSARIVRGADGAILAAVEYQLPLQSELMDLLSR